MKFKQFMNEDGMEVIPSGRPVAPIAGVENPDPLTGMSPVKPLARIGKDLRTTITGAQMHPNQPVNVSELGKEIANFILDITPGKNRTEAMNVIVPQVLDSIIEWFIVEHKMSNPLLKQISVNIEKRLAQMEKNPSNMRGIGI